MREFLQGDKGERGRIFFSVGITIEKEGEGVTTICVGKEGNHEGVDGGGKVGKMSEVVVGRSLVREEAATEKRS